MLYVSPYFLVWRYLALFSKCDVMNKMSLLVLVGLCVAYGQPGKATTIRCIAFRETGICGHHLRPSWNPSNHHSGQVRLDCIRGALKPPTTIKPRDTRDSQHKIFQSSCMVTVVVVWWQQDKNNKEAREETEVKSGRVHRGRWKMKRKYVVVTWQQNKNGKESREETEGKYGKVHRVR